MTLTAEEILALDEVYATKPNAVEECRAALIAALERIAAGALDDAGRAQVDAALVLYRALEGTPARDVVDLANRLTAAIQSQSYARAVEARDANMVAEQRFVSDPTISTAQLIEHVKALTRAVWELRRDA